MSNRNFDHILNEFIVSRDRTVALAVELSNMALEHFAEHGDTSQLGKLFNAMNKNQDRRVAFGTWAIAHAPITLDIATGVFKKDSSEERVAHFKDGVGEAVKCHLVQAAAKSFYDYAPVKEVMPFTGQDVVTRMRALIKRLENEAKFEATDDNATAMLAAAKVMVEELAAIPASITETQDDEHDNDAGSAAADPGPDNDEEHAAPVEAAA